MDLQISIYCLHHKCNVSEFFMKYIFFYIIIENDSYRTGGFPGSVTMAGAGPSTAAATAGGGGFTTIYPVTECMELGEGRLMCVFESWS